MLKFISNFSSQYAFPFIITFSMGLMCFISGVNVGSKYRAEQDELIVQKVAEEYKKLKLDYDFVHSAHCLYVKDVEEGK